MWKYLRFCSSCVHTDSPQSLKHYTVALKCFPKYRKCVNIIKAAAYHPTFTSLPWFLEHSSLTSFLISLRRGVEMKYSLTEAFKLFILSLPLASVLGGSCLNTGACNSNHAVQLFEPYSISNNIVKFAGSLYSTEQEHCLFMYFIICSTQKSLLHWWYLCLTFCKDFFIIQSWGPMIFMSKRTFVQACVQGLPWVEVNQGQVGLHGG